MQKNIKLLNTDCITWLNTCANDVFDMCIADPPYSSGGLMRSDVNSGSKFKYLRGTSQKSEALISFEGDSRDQRSYLYWSQLWMSEAIRALKPGGLLLVFTDWRQLPITTDAVQSAGAVWRGIVPWYKQASRPMADRYTSSCEYIIWATKGARAVDMKDKESTYPEGFYQYRPPSDRIHATEKPVELYKHLYNILRPNSAILDPFLGSGNSAIAAHQSNRGHKFIGTELSESVYEISKKRIDAACSQMMIPE